MLPKQLAADQAIHGDVQPGPRGPRDPVTRAARWYLKWVGQPQPTFASCVAVCQSGARIECVPPAPVAISPTWSRSARHDEGDGASGRCDAFDPRLSA